MKTAKKLAKDNENLRTALATSVAANVVYERLETAYDKALAVLRDFVGECVDEPPEDPPRCGWCKANLGEPCKPLCVRARAEALLSGAPEPTQPVDADVQFEPHVHLLREFLVWLDEQSERRSGGELCYVCDQARCGPMCLRVRTLGVLAGEPETAEPTAEAVAEAVREATVEHFAEALGECVGSDGVVPRAVASCYQMPLAPIIAKLRAGS